MTASSVASVTGAPLLTEATMTECPEPKERVVEPELTP